MESEKKYRIDYDPAFTDYSKRCTRINLPSDKGVVVAYHLFEGMQILFYDMNSANLPDLWESGLRKKKEDNYIRFLLCKNGGCRYKTSGIEGELSAGQVLIDSGEKDDCTFTFKSEAFTGVEITNQIDILANESVMFKMLRLVVDSMNIPKEMISKNGGYVFDYSSDTAASLDRFLKVGFSGDDEIRILSTAVETEYLVGVDIKSTNISTISKNERRKMIAADIYRTLTEDFGTKYTADYFARKYEVSDTTVKKYFKSVYGYGFKEYQVKVRMEWAAGRLKNSDMMMGEISDAIGYSKQTKFSKAFRDYYGVTPREYRSSSVLRAARKKNTTGNVDLK